MACCNERDPLRAPECAYSPRTAGRLPQHLEHRLQSIQTGRRASRRRRLPARRGGHRADLRHRTRSAHLARGGARGRAPAQGVQRSRLRPRPSRRPPARQPPGLLHALAGAQRARHQHRADQRRAALGRAGLPDRAQRHLARGGTAGQRGRAAHGGQRSERAARDDPTRGLGADPAGALDQPAGRPADQPQHRVRAALHLWHDRPAQGLPARQRLFPARRRVVPRPRRSRDAAQRCRALHHAAAAQPHERAGVLVDGGDPFRRLHRAARPLSSFDLVAERSRERRHGGALPRRHAGDAACRAARRGRPHARAALRLRRRRRPATSRRLRSALRPAAARGLGDDRDRRRRLRHGQPRAAPRRHALLRPRRAFRRDAHRRREGRRRRHRRARRAARARRRRGLATRLLSRLPEGRAGDRRGLGRRLVPHR